MNSLKNEGPKIVETKSRFPKGWIVALGVLLVAALALAPTLLGQADSGGVQGHSFDVTFTKWITAAPNMEGVVGGDVGDGAFAGEIKGMSTVGNTTTIQAVYHVKGSLHSFDAEIVAVQDNVAGTGVITGSVTDGWLKNMSLTGEYKVLGTCNIDTGGYGPMCFQGTLHIVPGP